MTAPQGGNSREQLIVVPLDGSELSEAALPYAVALARLLSAKVLLVTVWEEGERALIHSIPDHATDLFKRGQEHYEHYLERKSKDVEAQGVAVEANVRVGQAADEITHVIGQREPRLLVLSTHGRSGLSRWVYGSVANRLVREAPVTTLVVGPHVLERKQTEPAIRRILVPLDGSPLSEAAVQPAVELAEACGAGLVLAEVLQWQAQAISFGVANVDAVQVMEQLEQAAEAYLTKVRERISAEREVAIKVLRGAPAEALMDAVNAEKIDLVVMASHTRGPLGRAVLGSVADRMLQANAPVMYVRPESVPAVATARRGWFCHNCGRASPFIEVLPEDRCLRCGQHLHTCGNCVYYDGVACMLKRPEVHDTIPGRNCAYFQFRETEAAAAQSGGGVTR
jgi:nucleotide-binding universal stress UspA family protein